MIVFNDRGFTRSALQCRNVCHNQENSSETSDFYITAHVKLEPLPIGETLATHPICYAINFWLLSGLER